jgi:hypothetical protein
MIPDPARVPEDIRILLRQLTMAEEMLLSPVLVLMSLYRVPGTAVRTHRGFCANFRQDTLSVVRVLPRLHRDIPF